MKPNTRLFYSRAVQSAVERVVEGLDQALDLQALARVASLSTFHFHRIFRGMVGETPLEMHRRLRLERAAWTLVNEEVSVTEVAFAAGYETHESFTRAFRAHYACTPSDLRRRREPAGDAGCGGPFRIEIAAHSGIHFDPFRSSPPTLPNPSGAFIMDVEIKELSQVRLATVRHVGPYNRIPEAFARLGQIAESANLFGPEAAMIAVYHDDPETTPLAELRSDAALAVAPGVALPDSVGELTLAAGRYACTIHVGSYATLGDTWARMMGQWLPQSGCRVADGLPFERYRNTPGEVPESELRTELYVPIARGAV